MDASTSVLLMVCAAAVGIIVLVAGATVYVVLRVRNKGGKLRCIPMIGSILGLLLVGASVYYGIATYKTSLANSDDGSQPDPLISAAGSDDIATVQTLINGGESPNDGFTGTYSPLMSACENNFYDVAQFLVTSGADVNAKDENDTTPLLYCLQNGNNNEQMVKLLLDHGAAINTVDSDGYTPLMTVCMNDDFTNISTVEAIVSLLVKNGADVNNQSIEGLTALDYARASYEQIAASGGIDTDVKAEYDRIFKQLGDTGTVAAPADGSTVAPGAEPTDDPAGAGDSNEDEG